MALDNTQSGFGFDVEKRLDKRKPPVCKDESTPTVTLTPTYTPAHAPDRKAKERKSERLQLVVRPSTKSRLAKYAEDHNTSSNEVVQRLLEELLDNSGY